MLLLGVVQAQAAGDVSFGSYDLLATEILTGSAASVTFSSLGDYATDYQHLQIRFVNKTTKTFADNMSMRLNGDTGNNYATHRLFAQGSSVSSFAGSSQNNMFVGRHGSTAANVFAPGVIDILDPFESNKNTTVRSLSGHVLSGDNQIVLYSGVWLNTAAVTSINIFPPSVSFTADSRFSLYGLRK